MGTRPGAACSSVVPVVPVVPVVAARLPEADDDACCDQQGTDDTGGARPAETECDGGEQCAHGDETGEEARAVGADPDTLAARIIDTLPRGDGPCT
ncbi:hypothetical protein OOK13_18725 [Streptomyces sp. NBC_00378]|uniref:hypothetical protein n=1 Tax=unclassified Streptomyces TaxID=2593676 RepID=UPI00224E223F|nr:MULTISPECIES: hypothetical protein [unclassified Streptomyces]MCX5110548.1 hypothetical protein [Streptomyces sp. NBC_00378]